jgi:hypothetical protein
MTSDEFIAWLERKFQEVGVQKVVPDEKTLAAAYRRAIRVARISKAIEAAAGENPDTEIAIPEHLADRIRDRIAGTASAWDHALADLVNKEIRNS